VDVALWQALGETHDHQDDDRHDDPRDTAWS
jgi:hypothetical protein